jgi:hypothetical protein
VRLEASVGLVRALAEVPGRYDAKALRVGDDQRAGRVRAAQPLLTRDREEVEPFDVVRDRTDRLGAVRENGDATQRAQLA